MKDAKIMQPEPKAQDGFSATLHSLISYINFISEKILESEAEYKIGVYLNF